MPATTVLPMQALPLTLLLETGQKEMRQSLRSVIPVLLVWKRTIIYGTDTTFRAAEGPLLTWKSRPAVIGILHSTSYLGFGEGIVGMLIADRYIEIIRICTRTYRNPSPFRTFSTIISYTFIIRTHDTRGASDLPCNPERERDFVSPTPKSRDNNFVPVWRFWFDSDPKLVSISSD